MGRTPKSVLKRNRISLSVYDGMGSGPWLHASCRHVVALLWLVPVYSVAQAEEPSVLILISVKIAEVKVRMSDHGPVVLLQAEGRTIPIFVDLTVALSIQSALSGEKLPRPMTHDLMHTILDAYGGKVTQTVITLKNGTLLWGIDRGIQGSGQGI